MENVQQTLWMTTRTYRAPFGIVKNTDECHGLLIEVHVFLEGFSKVCHEESVESIRIPGGTEHVQTVCTRLFFFAHTQEPGNEAKHSLGRKLHFV